MPVAQAAVSRHRSRQETPGDRAGVVNSIAREALPLASFGTYVLAAAIVSAALVFYVFLRVSSLHLGYVLTQSRQEQLRLVLENRALETEIGTLSAPARIRQFARDDLGMVPGEKLVDLSAGAK